MSFTDDLVLDDADGTDITYRLTGRTASGSRRIDIATDLRNPAFLRIEHTLSGKGAGAVDRHLAQLSRAVTDSTGVQVVGTVNVTINVPRNEAFTNQMVYDLVANMLDFLSDGALTTALSDTDAVASLLRGES